MDSQREVEAKNKALVLKAYQAIYGDNDLSAVDKYFHKNIICHNPTVGDGIEAVREVLQTVWCTGPKKVLDIRRTAAENDLVWIHCKFPDPANEGQFFNVMDICRIEGDKIVEHWDCIQSIPADIMKTSKNPHPFF